MTLEQFIDAHFAPYLTAYTPLYGQKQVKGFVVAVPLGICADCRKPCDDHHPDGRCPT